MGSSAWGELDRSQWLSPQLGVNNVELSICEGLAIDVILAAKPGWPPEPDLVAAGVGVEILADLRERGLVVSWDRVGLPRAWTLTPWGAVRFGVELEEWSGSGRACWTPIPRNDPRRCRGVRVVNSLARVAAAVVTDPRPGPLEQLLINEWNARRIRLFAGSVRRSRIAPIRLRATTRPDRVTRDGEPLKGGLGGFYDEPGVIIEQPDGAGNRRRRLLASSLIAAHGNGHANGNDHGSTHRAEALEMLVSDRPVE